MITRAAKEMYKIYRYFGEVSRDTGIKYETLKRVYENKFEELKKERNLHYLKNPYECTHQQEQADYIQLCWDSKKYTDMMISESTAVQLEIDFEGANDLETMINFYAW